MVRAVDSVRGVEPMLEFTTGDGRAVVGVVCRGAARDGGSAIGKGAVLPTLAVHPYLFDNPNASESLADLRFDAVGRAVLLETLQRIEKE